MQRALLGKKLRCAGARLAEVKIVACDSGADGEALRLTQGRDVDGVGNDLDNVLIGNRGDNRLDGGAGDDTLTGGNGADQFAFSGAFGADQVVDFDPNGDGDVLDFAGTGLSLGDLTIAAVGGDTLITTPGGDSVRLLGVNPNALDLDTDLAFG